MMDRGGVLRVLYGVVYHVKRSIGLGIDKRPLQVHRHEVLYYIKGNTIMSRK